MRNHGSARAEQEARPKARGRHHDADLASSLADRCPPGPKQEQHGRAMASSEAGRHRRISDAVVTEQRPGVGPRHEAPAAQRPGPRSTPARRRRSTSGAARCACPASRAVKWTNTTVLSGARAIRASPRRSGSSRPTAHAPTRIRKAASGMAPGAERALTNRNAASPAPPSAVAIIAAATAKDPSMTRPVYTVDRPSIAIRNRG